MFGSNAEYVFTRRDNTPLDEETLSKIYNLLNTFQFPASLTEFNQEYISSLPEETRHLLMTNEYEFFKYMIEKNFPDQDIIMTPLPKTLVQLSWFTKCMSPFMNSTEENKSESESWRFTPFFYGPYYYSPDFNISQFDLNKNLSAHEAQEKLDKLNKNPTGKNKSLRFFLQIHLEKLKRGAENYSDYSIHFISEQDQYALWKSYHSFLSGLVTDYSSRIPDFSPENRDHLSKVVDGIKQNAFDQVNDLKKHHDQLIENIKADQGKAFFMKKTHYDSLDILKKFGDLNSREDIFIMIIDQELQSMFEGNLYTLYSISGTDINLYFSTDNDTRSVSLGDGYFSAPFFDSDTGMPAANEYGSHDFIHVLKFEKKDFLQKDAELNQMFYIPPVMNCFRMMGRYEFHHPRTMYSGEHGAKLVKKEESIKELTSSIKTTAELNQALRNYYRSAIDSERFTVIRISDLSHRKGPEIS